MNFVYIVTHVHEQVDESEDVKFIGVYRSKEAAELAVQKTSQKPGFAKAKDGFHIEKYELDKDHWLDGFVTI